MLALFDVGGTNTRLALSEDGRTFTHTEHIRTDSGAGGFEMFTSELKRLIAGHPVTMVAGGMPGHLDQTGLLQQTPNLPGWIGKPVLERLREQLRLPVFLENDTAVVGLGEAVYGAGRGHDLVVYMTVSTGVNGARIVGGGIDRSVTGFELGSMLLPNEYGQLVSLESLAGGAALEHRLGRHPRNIKDPEVWRQEARHLARALYNTLLHWSPEVVVYGGGMMRDIRIEVIEHELAMLPPVFTAWPPLKLAQLGPDGGLYGALALARSHQPSM